MGSALAAKPNEKKAISASREPASCRGSEWNGSAAMAAFLQSGGCGCPECAAKAGIQAKLPIGQVGDQYERHADLVAEAASVQVLSGKRSTLAAPARLGPIMPVWMWTCNDLLAFFLSRGLLNRIRRRKAARRSGESAQP
jgi:hypothetical protein